MSATTTTTTMEMEMEIMDVEVEAVVNQLRDRLDGCNSNRASIQAQLDEICAKLREQISAMEENVNNALMEVFTKEDSEVQETLCSILKLAGNRKRDPKQNKELAVLVAKAKAELLVKRSYSLKKRLSFILDGAPSGGGGGDDAADVEGQEQEEQDQQQEQEPEVEQEPSLSKLYELIVTDEIDPKNLVLRSQKTSEWWALKQRTSA